MSDGQTAAIGFPRSLAVLAWLLCAPWNLVNADAPPADPCALLPAAELKAVLGVKFDSPTKVSMPPAVAFGVTGTKCVYQAGGADPHTVILIVYVDGSGAEADANLTKLASEHSRVSPTRPTSMQIMEYTPARDASGITSISCPS
jgi:hypothetical protein